MDKKIIITLMFFSYNYFYAMNFNELKHAFESQENKKFWTRVLDKNGYPLIIGAIINQDVTLVNNILSIDPVLSNETHTRSALAYAAFTGNLELIQIILHYKGTLKDDNELLDVLKFAIKKNDIYLLKIFLLYVRSKDMINQLQDMVRTTMTSRKVTNLKIIQLLEHEKEKIRVEIKPEMQVFTDFCRRIIREHNPELLSTLPDDQLQPTMLTILMNHRKDLREKHSSQLLSTKHGLDSPLQLVVAKKLLSNTNGQH